MVAGIGGDGGDHNDAEGGDVDVKATIESANLNDSLNTSNTTISTIQACSCTADRHLREAETGGQRCRFSLRRQVDEQRAEGSGLQISGGDRKC